MSVGVVLWRIAVDAAEYTADDTTGAGAKRSGGRWNRKGRAVLYTSEHVAMAALETLVHLNSGGIPLNRYLVKVDVPFAAWNARKVLAPGDLPVGWDAIPEGKVSLDIGEAWLVEQASPILIVPSVVAPEERNVLINPVHALAAGVTATKVRRWLYDPRMLGRLAAGS